MSAGYDPRNHLPTQPDRIIAYLRKHDSLTVLEAAIRLKITKLPTRIGELKQKGYRFSDVWESGEGTKYKRYSLLTA